MLSWFGIILFHSPFAPLMLRHLRCNAERIGIGGYVFVRVYGNL